MPNFVCVNRKKGAIKVLTDILDDILVDCIILFYKDPNDKGGGHKYVHDEIPLKVRWTNQGSISKSTF